MGGKLADVPTIAQSEQGVGRYVGNYEVSTAGLEVTKTDEDEEEVNEQWGFVQFETLPTAGDYIHIWRDLDYQILRVTEVVHKVVPYPLPDDNEPAKKPSTLVLAEWVTVDLRPYALA